MTPRGRQVTAASTAARCRFCGWSESISAIGTRVCCRIAVALPGIPPAVDRAAMKQPIVIGEIDNEIDDSPIDDTMVDDAVPGIVEEIETVPMLGAVIQDLILQNLGRAPTAPMEEEPLIDLIDES